MLYSCHIVVYAEQAAEAAAAVSSSSTDGLIIFSIILNVIIFAFGYGKLSNQVKNVSRRLDKQEEKLDRIAESLREKIDRVAEGLAELRRPFLAFKENIATRSMSLVVLTKYGNKILQESGGEEVLKDVFENVYPKFEGFSNPYDIQRKAVEVVEDLIDKNDQIKTYLYEEPVNLKTMTDVLGITLRDMVFERRGMPVKKPDDEEPESFVRQNKEKEKEKIRTSK